MRKMTLSGKPQGTLLASVMSVVMMSHIEVNKSI